MIDLITDFLKKRPLKLRMNAVLLASGLTVGFTRYSMLSGHRGWYLFLTCVIAGYFASVIIAVITGALCAFLHDLDFKADFERVTIIAGMTLIVASLLFLIAFHSGGAFDYSD